MLDTAVTGPESTRSRPRPLLRTTLGRVLRRTRRAQGRTLADVARAARVSMPYLSEVERGRKEASSEVLAAICDALRIELSDLLAVAGHDLAQLRRSRAAGRARARRAAGVPGELVPVPGELAAAPDAAGRDLDVSAAPETAAPDAAERDLAAAGAPAAAADAEAEIVHTGAADARVAGAPPADAPAADAPAADAPAVDARAAAVEAAEPSARVLRLAPAADPDAPAPYGRGSGGDITCQLAA